jgi:hypothetical protein
MSKDISPSQKMVKNKMTQILIKIFKRKLKACSLGKIYIMASAKNALMKSALDVDLNII